MQKRIHFRTDMEHNICRPVNNSDVSLGYQFCKNITFILYIIYNVRYNINGFWTPCLGPLFFLLPKTLNYLTFQSFNSECTWWKLFLTRAVHTKLDIYVFIDFPIFQLWSFNSGCTWWKLFLTRAVHTKLDIYVFIDLLFLQEVVEAVLVEPIVWPQPVQNLEWTADLRHCLSLENHMLLLILM